MYDSVTVADIPRTATMVAGYTDGRYANVIELRQAFPTATLVQITTSSTGHGHANVIDCEKGDATPAEAAVWASFQDQAGEHPGIYCNFSTWPAVKAEVAKHPFHRPPLYWIARWDRPAKLIRGTIATQYANPLTSGGHYDLSIVRDYWPGVDPTPTTPLTRAHRRYVKALNKSWPHRTHPLPAADQHLVEQLLTNGQRITEL